MNLFALAGLSLAVGCFLLAAIILKFARRNSHRIWALFNIVVGTWGLGTYFVGIAHNEAEALTSWRFAYAGGVFISVLFYHLVYVFCDLKKKRMLFFAYAQGILFFVLDVATDTFISPLAYLFD